MAISREHAIEVAWRLLKTKIAESEIESVSANFVDGTWSVVFQKKSNSCYVDAPGCLIIDVSSAGEPTWFNVL